MELCIPKSTKVLFCVSLLKLKQLCIFLQLVTLLTNTALFAEWIHISLQQRHYFFLAVVGGEDEWLDWLGELLLLLPPPLLTKFFLVKNVDTILALLVLTCIITIHRDSTYEYGVQILAFFRSEKSVSRCGVRRKKQETKFKQFFCFLSKKCFHF